jgi:hypothetical protein
MGFGVMSWLFAVLTVGASRSHRPAAATISCERGRSRVGRGRGLLDPVNRRTEASPSARRPPASTRGARGREMESGQNLHTLEASISCFARALAARLTPCREPGVHTSTNPRTGPGGWPKFRPLGPPQVLHQLPYKRRGSAHPSSDCWWPTTMLH